MSVPGVTSAPAPTRLPRPMRHAVEQDRAHPDQAEIFDGARVDDRGVTDRAVIADRRAGESRRHVDDRAVLDRRARADADRHDVAAQHGRVPDRRLVADHDVADHRAGLGEEHAAARASACGRRTRSDRHQRRGARARPARRRRAPRRPRRRRRRASGAIGATNCTMPRQSITMNERAIGLARSRATRRSVSCRRPRARPATSNALRIDSSSSSRGRRRHREHAARRAGLRAPVTPIAIRVEHARAADAGGSSNQADDRRRAARLGEIVDRARIVDVDELGRARRADRRRCWQHVRARRQRRDDDALGAPPRTNVDAARRRRARAP